MRENAAPAPSDGEAEATRTATVLIVDDDPQLRAMLGHALRPDGFRVEEAASGEEALGRLEDGEPDVILLDVLMPGLGGFETCRRIREHSSVPIILLTALGRDEDIVAGLQAGADDVCTKPIGLGPLAARIRAHLRRRELDAASSHHVPSVDGGDLALDSRARQAIVRGRAVDLSPREFGLLERLARSPGRVVSSRALLQHVWGSTSPEHLATLRSYIKLLREKLEPDPHHPRYIRSRPRLGYLLADGRRGPAPADVAGVASGPDD